MDRPAKPQEELGVVFGLSSQPATHTSSQGHAAGNTSVSFQRRPTETQSQSLPALSLGSLASFSSPLPPHTACEASVARGATVAMSGLLPPALPVTYDVVGPRAPITETRVGAEIQAAPSSSSPDLSYGARFTGAPDVFSVNDSAEDEGNLEVVSDQVPHIIFSKMLSYITQCFPEAKGHQEKMNRPEPPVENRPVEHTSRVRLTRAKPIQFSLDMADKALLRANETSRPSLARYPGTNTEEFTLLAAMNLQVRQPS